MDLNSEGFRLLHTMIRVIDLDKSIDFYTRLLGMKLLRKVDNAIGRFTLAFVGYKREEDASVIELTYNWDQKTAYEHGNAFGHLAIAVPNAYTTCDNLEKEGIYISRPAGPMKGSERVIAFIEDPDGYKIELVQRD